MRGFDVARASGAELGARLRHEEQGAGRKEEDEEAKHFHGIKRVGLFGGAGGGEEGAGSSGCQ